MNVGLGHDEPVTDRDLVISACRSECSWSETADRLDGERLFACEACGSEWVRSQPWTPVDWEGYVPDAVQSERARGPGPS
jgi:hypothetical protein